MSATLQRLLPAGCLPACLSTVLCRHNLPLRKHAAEPAPPPRPPCCSGYLSFNIPADGSLRGEREPLMAQARPALVQAAPSFSRGYSTFFDA